MIGARQLALALLGATAATAAEPKPIIIDYRAYTISEALAFPLLKELRGSRPEAGVSRLHALAADGQARLEGAVKLHAIDGLATSADGGEEQRYPIEWNQIGGFGADMWREMLGHTIADHLEPALVETRFMGTSLNVTANVEPQSSGATLQIIGATTRLRGWFRSPSVFTAAGVAVSYPQPRFATARIAANITVPAGKWVLLSAQSDSAQIGHITFHLVRVTIPSAPNFPP